jgi:hypothetical protein
LRRTSPQAAAVAEQKPAVTRADRDDRLRRALSNGYGERDRGQHECSTVGDAERLAVGDVFPNDRTIVTFGPCVLTRVRPMNPYDGCVATKPPRMSFDGASAVKEAPLTIDEWRSVSGRTVLTPDGAVIVTRGHQVRRLIVVALIALVVLNVVDVITTRMVLHSVRGVEQNPVSRAPLQGDRAEIAKAIILTALALHGLRGLGAGLRVSRRAEAE